MVKKWEYKIIVGDEVDERNLNRLGEAGWELVAVTPNVVERDGLYHSKCAYLKREKS